MNTVKELAKKWYDIIGFPSKFDEEFEKLLAEENDVSQMKFEEYNLEANISRKGKNLIMFLYFCEELSQKYDEKGISGDILLSTLTDFIISAERQYAINGEIGIVMPSVLKKHLSMKLFRLGRLQFEMAEISVDVPEKGIQKGARVMNIHIPAGVPLTKEELSISFKMADEFFGKYFPEYHYDYYMCHSWLLDETLKKFLKKGSNILEFQKLFYPVLKPESDAILRFMFKYHIINREELNKCSAATHFAKIVKEYALSGGKFYNVLGVCHRNNILKGWNNMKIVENGKPVCGISLPPCPTPREVFAAEELVKYIKEISGAELCLSVECENTIIIGSPERNPLAEKVISRDEFTASVPGPEGFIIKTAENMLLLAGSDSHTGEQERGTLYAAYELLERFLGCSLSAYCKEGINAGEFVPAKADIKLNDICLIKPCSDIGYRTAIVQHGPWVGNPDHALNEKFMSWLGKNRYNRILTWTDIYEGYKENGMLDEAEKRGILFSVGHHQAITMLLPHKGNKYFPEAYNETHPDFYRLLEDGTRYRVTDGDYSGQLILCMRNEELISTVAENMVKWSDMNPQVDVICLWPHDGKDEQCFCEKCRAHSKSTNYSYFVSRVIEKVNAKKPHLKIDRIAYVDLLECDAKKISPNIIIDEAVWHSKLRCVGKPDGSCFKDSEFEKNILEWKNTGVKVVYYDYLMGIYSHKQKWMPTADEMQAVCKRFVEKGIYGLGTQMECYNMWNHIFNFYTYGRTAYDTSLSMEDNLEMFCRIFGKGAPFIREIIKLGEAVADGQTPIQSVGKYLIDNIDKEKVYSLYEKALNAAEAPRARNNIRLMRMVWRYTDLEVNSPSLEPDGTPSHISMASDETGELWYMHKNFDSFISGNEGFGISIPVKKRSDAEFAPDKWYLFE